MIYVIKANGKKELFDEYKVMNSIKRARIPESIRPQVLQYVKGKLYDGISTAEMYRYILEFLGQSEHPYFKSRYSLKESIMMLGPTGYPFEDFVARILESFGYKTKVRQILNGKCVRHEIDIIAEKDWKTSIIEVKFHNNPGIESDVHVALYTYARFLDVQSVHKYDDVWLVTNTKATLDAITYARCQSMKIMSWGYPEGESFRDIVERSRLHPVTILSSLSNGNKLTLLENHVVLCKDIYRDNTLLDLIPLSREEKEKVLTEVKIICQEEE